jgi:hypothetical protein
MCVYIYIYSTFVQNKYIPHTNSCTPPEVEQSPKGRFPQFGILWPSTSEVDVDIGKFKKYKSPNVDQIPTELIQAGKET